MHLRSKLAVNTVQARGGGEEGVNLLVSVIARGSVTTKDTTTCFKEEGGGTIRVIGIRSRFITIRRIMPPP